MRLKTQPLLVWGLLLLLCFSMPVLHAQRDPIPDKNGIKELTQLRKDVEATGFRKYAPELFASGEKNYKQALALMKRGDSRKAQALAKEAEKNYREVVTQGLLRGPLADAEKELKALQRQADPGAYKEAQAAMARLARDVRGSTARKLVISDYVERIRVDIGDILGTLIPPVKRPDTLYIAGFTMVVERYDDLGTYYSHCPSLRGAGGPGADQI